MELMPTPFQHLVYAKSLLEDPTLPAALSGRLQAQAGAFLLGNTAGDVQVVSGQPRPETHFYAFPPRGRPRAWQAMVQAYPELADPDTLAPDRAAFVAGYSAHLIWDEVWAWEVYIPSYLESGVWEGRLARSVHHNALRVLLDRRAAAELATWSPLVPALQAVEPVGWLPFVAEGALRRWRDWLTEQLVDPERGATAQVFAERMGVSVAALEDKVREVAASAGRADADPWTVQLWEAIARYEQRGRAESRAAIAAYFESKQPVTSNQ